MLGNVKKRQPGARLWGGGGYAVAKIRRKITIGIAHTIMKCTHTLVTKTPNYKIVLKFSKISKWYSTLYASHSSKCDVTTGRVMCWWEGTGDFPAQNVSLCKYISLQNFQSPLAKIWQQGNDLTLSVLTSHEWKWNWLKFQKTLQFSNLIS